MSLKNEKLRLIAILTLFTVVLVACGTAAQPTEDGQHDETMAREEGDDHDDTGVERVPNNGAVIRLIAPEDGAVIQGGEVEFEIEVENFVLGADGNHWHIYIDGESWGMVLGETTTQVLRGIPAGDHHVEIFLSNGDHQDLEDHAAADITIEE